MASRRDTKETKETKEVKETKETKETKEIVEVNGLTITEGVVYKVTHKPDSNREDSYPEEGATKFPSEGILDLFQCKYIITDYGNSTGVWDTGLYAESPCYASMDINEVNEIVKSLRTNIVEPYERKYGRGILSHENDSFWVAKYFTLMDGQVFNMNSPEHRLDLYMALRTFKLTPKEFINDYRFKDSMYCVQDETKVRSRNAERSANKMSAIKMYTVLGTTDVRGLKAIMAYVGFSAFDSSADDRTKDGMFSNWVDSSADNVQAFLDAYNLYADKDTTDEVFLYSKLPLAVKKKIIERDRGAYYFEETVVGGDLKTASRRINSDKTFEDLKTTILEL